MQGTFDVHKTEKEIFRSVFFSAFYGSTFSFISVQFSGKFNQLISHLENPGYATVLHILFEFFFYFKNINF